MKFITPFIILAATIGLAEASITGHHAHIARANHHQLKRNVEVRAPDSNSTAKKRARCKSKQPDTLQKPGNNAAKPPTDANKDSSKAAPPPPPPPPPPSGGGGVINSGGGACGPSGAQSTPSALTGPNGSIDWLNCGIDGAGWNPAYAGVWDIKYADLATVMSQPGNPFENCKQYLWAFQQNAATHNLPAILLASIAMQESGCRPDAVGQGGEQGMMQITREKCEGRDDYSCRDVGFNVGKGAQFLADSLNAHGGNIISTMGGYNGWFKDMTIAQATAAQYTSCCRCQNNLDYLHMLFNGWCVGVDPVAGHFGKYFNLAVCPA